MSQLKCPKCNNDIDNAGVCPHCGAEIFICPECGAAYEGKQEKCPNCGFEFTTAKTETATQPEIPQPAITFAAENDDKPINDVAEKWRANSFFGKPARKALTILYYVFYYGGTFATLVAAVVMFVNWSKGEHNIVSFTSMYDKIKICLLMADIFCIIAAVREFGRRYLLYFGFAKWSKQNNINLTDILKAHAIENTKDGTKNYSIVASGDYVVHNPSEKTRFFVWFGVSVALNVTAATLFGLSLNSEMNGLLSSIPEGFEAIKFSELALLISFVVVALASSVWGRVYYSLFNSGVKKHLTDIKTVQQPNA